jgi:hypothetical protein
MMFVTILIMYVLGGLLAMWNCDPIAVWWLVGLSLFESFKS